MTGSRTPANARIAAVFESLQKRSERAFMPFVVIGDPSLEASAAVADALVEGGADIMEFGFPFSDPPADGPVIQAADERALAAGTTPDDCLEFIAAFRQRHDVPVALLIYFNLILQRGVDAFYEAAAAAGVDAILAADVPLELSGPLVDAGRKHGIAPIFIASELTTAERMAEIAKVADGYIYAVARIGITGEKSEVDAGLPATLGRIREATQLPILAGFGISTPDHARRVAGMNADGAITGSAIVRRIAAHAAGELSLSSLCEELRAFTRAMKAATRPA